MPVAAGSAFEQIALRQMEQEHLAVVVRSLGRLVEAVPIDCSVAGIAEPAVAPAIGECAGCVAGVGFEQAVAEIDLVAVRDE